MQRPYSKRQLLLGAVTLVFAGTLLFIILLPAIIPLILAWLVVEVLFWMLVASPTAKQLDAQPEGGHWPPEAEAHDQTAFNRFLKYWRDTPGLKDYQSYLSGWFLGADIDSIKRGNFEEFAAYGFCYKSREQLAAEGYGDLPSQMVSQMEEVWDIECPKGYNPDVKFMAHLWEPLNGGYRPLAFYLLVELVAYCSRQYLSYKGFQQHRHAGLNYYTLDLQAPSKAPAKQNGSSDDTSAAALAAPDAAVGLKGPPSDTAATQISQGASLPPLSPSTASAAFGADGSLLQQLQPIAEQPTHLHHHARDLSQGEQLSCSSSAQASARHSTTVSGVSEELSEADLDLLTSPFAISAASPEIAAAVAAGVISEVPEGEDVGRGSGAARQEGGSNACALRAKSMPAVAAEADAPQQQQQPQIKQRASCSVLPRRLTARPSMPPHKIKPLQAALSQALSEAGVLEAGVPVVFVHGIGGLPAYLELLHWLEAEGSPLLAVEVKSVAMRMGPVYPVRDVAAAVLGMMDKMGIKQACFVAHSYGTFITSFIAKQHPKRMRGCVLIDPVCCGMFLPNLTYNFLYKKPTLQGWSKPQLLAYVKAAVRRFVSTEVHVRASLARSFYWTELCAYPEDLPAGSTILLSGKDDLMDSPEVEAMFKRAPHIKVKYNEMLTHGAFLLNKEVKKAIRMELQALLASSGSAVAGLAKQLSTLVHPAAGAAAALPSRASSAMMQTLRKVQSLHPAIGRAGSSSGGRDATAGAAGGEKGQQEKQPAVRSYSEGTGVVGEDSGEVAAPVNGCAGPVELQKTVRAGGEGSSGKPKLPALAVSAERDVAAAVPDQQQ